MKKTNILKLALGITSFGLLGGAIASGYSSKYISKDQKLAEIHTGEVEASSAFGAEKGTISFKYETPDHVIITDVSSSFLVKSSSFNWGGGHFEINNIKYTIVEFGPASVSPNSWNHYFINCYMTIPGTVKVLRHECFQKNSCNSQAYNKTELLGIYFDEGVETIEYDAFWKCNDLKYGSTTIKLPNSIKILGHSAFQDCALKTLDLSAVDHIIRTEDDGIPLNIDALSQDDSKAVFYDNSDLKTIYVYSYELAEQMQTTIPWKTCGEKGKVNVTTIDIPAINFGGKSGTIKVQYENNFYNDAHIIGHSDDFVAINKFDFNGGHVSYDGKDYTITSIEPQAFSTTIFNSNKLFYNCDLVIPSTIKTIGTKAFANDNDSYNAKTISEITSITFQEGVQTIESWAFKNVFGYKYGAITFPNSITTINAGAFANSNLAQINLYKLDHVIHSNTNNPISIFGNNIKKIYVHDSNIKNNYLNIEGGKWSEISSLIESVY